jgi:hypothetical protein
MTALWLSAGCVACAIAGFSLVRVVARVLSEGTTQASPLAMAASTREVSPALRSLAEEAPRPPAPTTLEPDHEKLELWAGQIRAGERKMSVATDGCRVTWNRTCKHGHPTWLVHLGYVSSQPAERTGS